MTRYPDRNDLIEAHLYNIEHYQEEMEAIEDRMDELMDLVETERAQLEELRRGTTRS